MQITIDPSLSADDGLRAAVANRAPLLAGIVNGTATAEWRKGTNWEGKPAAQLRLRDSSGAKAGADLLPVEFANADALATRFRDLSDALRTVREWRETVARLFDVVRPWCAALSGAVVTEVPIRALERASGEYDITQLVVVRAGRTFTVRPVGAWVLAADGRVDLLGSNYRAVLQYTRATDHWYHVPDAAPYRELPLTEPLFRELAEACLDD